jgi:acetylornithine deacetylase/succinyl-diaminopimelate desuccinylase-like protein
LWRNEFSIRFASSPKEKALLLVQDCLEAGLASYIGLYGDKTAVTDPATGKPMVARHYDLRQKGDRIIVGVRGAAGHMGSIPERDGAITKAAHLLRSLVRSKARLEKLGSEVSFELGSGGETTSGQNLVLEGGQGFVPTHPINEVMQRLQQAAQRGAANYLHLIRRNEATEQIVKVTYEKLHNVAFDGDANSQTVANALAGARGCGIWKGEPVLGWTVSCDARLFATEYPGMPVLTFGPGQLVHAHSDHEQIAIEEIRKAAEFIALFLLLQTGTVSDSK